MGARGYALLGILAYLVALAVLLPARFVAARVEALTNGAVQVRDAEGTAWHGRAEATLRSAAGAIPVESLAWRFKPSRLLAGRIAFDVSAVVAGLDARLEAGRAPGGWTLHDAALRGDAAALGARVPLLGALRPGGLVAASIPRWEWSGTAARGEARIEWQAATLGLSAVQPLGSWRAEVRADGGAPQAEVGTLEGPLRIRGKATFAPPARLAFEGEARAEGRDAPALQGLLDAMGPRRPDGAHAIRWQSP